MLEEVVYALLLHEPTNKVKIGLTVLYAVLPFAVVSSKSILKVSESLIFEYFFDDIGHSLLLEDSTIGRSGQKPKPRHNSCPVPIKLKGSHCLGKTAYKTVEIANFVIRQVKPKCHILTDYIRSFYLFFFTGQL